MTPPGPAIALTSFPVHEHQFRNCGQTQQQVTDVQYLKFSYLGQYLGLDMACFRWERNVLTLDQ